MSVDFNRLRVFFHVHQAGSVTAAATALHVTQSAVSQSLAKLEEEVGVPLFIRRHRRLVPTPAGTTLYGVMDGFVDALEQGLAEARRLHHELHGVLRVGAPVEFGSHRLPGVFAAFRRQHPGVSFELVLGHPSELLPRLDDGLLDLAFTDVFDADAPSGFEIVEVFEEQLVMVASADYEAEHLQGRRGFRALGECSFVAYGARAPAIRGWFRHHFGKVPASLSVGLVVESVRAVLSAVGEGMGLAVVPLHTVEDGPLVVLSTRRRAISHRVALARLFDKVPSRAERTFVRFISESL